MILALILAQVVAADGSVDLTALLKMMVDAVGDFRTGAILAGIAVVVNLLVNLTKLPFIDRFIPDKARPFIAVLLGVVGSVVTAKLNGQPWIGAIGAGITVGLGSVGFHEIVQALQSKPGDVVAKVVNAAAEGDAAAQKKVDGLSDQLNDINHLEPAQQARALADWAKTHPVPPAAMGG